MRTTSVLTILFLLLIGFIGALYWRQPMRKGPQEAVSPVAPPARHPIGSPIRHPVAPGEEAVSVTLDDSDGALRSSFANLLADPEFARLIHLDRLIRRIVVTVDNLPGEKLPRQYLPLQPPAGTFRVTGAGDSTLVASPANAKRYVSYIRLAEAVDVDLLTSVYYRLYPLFQQAYEELGYPDRYFNDRLIEVIDHLLATPAVPRPAPLVAYNLSFKYADPQLEKLSAGQKMLLRLDPGQESALRAKLQAFRGKLIGGMGERTALRQREN